MGMEVWEFLKLEIPRITKTGDFFVYECLKYEDGCAMKELKVKKKHLFESCREEMRPEN